MPERSGAYLEECAKTGRWRAVECAERDPADLAKIVADFIRTTRWKRPLNASEQSFLMTQIEATVPPDDVWREAR
jgi:hypothetical protein